MDGMILIPIMLPAAGGFVLLALSFLEQCRRAAGAGAVERTDAVGKAETAGEAGTAGKVETVERTGAAERTEAAKEAGTAGKAETAGEAGAAGKAEAAGEAETAGKAETVERTGAAERTEAAGEAGTAGKAEAAGEAGAAGKAEAAGEAETAGKAETAGESGRRPLYIFVAAVMLLSAASAVTVVWITGGNLTLFPLVDGIPIYFCVDGIGKWFVTIVTIVWALAGFYAFVYMRREGEKKRYFGWYLLLYGVLVGLDFSGNLVTMYLFYELMTLVSVPLVLHNGTREAVMAALKYLFYSLCGAYAGLFGIFFLYRFCDSLTFAAGGTLNGAAITSHEGMILAVVFVMILGFGAKAGMFPLHAWLPAAHPAAPSPASAFLSGVIVKCGVLATVRAVFYIVGPDFIRGTWVQYAWIVLTLFTVFMGSLLAFREPVLKKRLAYSTVSQVSYILFGLSLLTVDGFMGAMLHTLSHALVKSGLFLTAGVFLHQCGFTRVDQLAGIGKRMPKTMCCDALLSLALIGIPPTGGFVSKWYLAQGALQSDTGALAWLGPVTLLASALLTAGYLLPIVTAGFFPGKDVKKGAVQRQEPPLGMLLPLMILAALAVLAGIFPNPLIRYAAGLATSLLQ